MESKTKPTMIFSKTSSSANWPSHQHINMFGCGSALLSNEQLILNGNWWVYSFAEHVLVVYEKYRSSCLNHLVQVIYLKTLKPSHSFFLFFFFAFEEHLHRCLFKSSVTNFLPLKCVISSYWCFNIIDRVGFGVVSVISVSGLPHYVVMSENVNLFHILDFHIFSCQWTL